MIRIGARTSPLARVQADHIAALLAARGVRSEFVGITTTGDIDRRALTEIGGTGVFAQAVRSALAAGEIDVAVHSLKDLPTAPEPELELVAVPVREDVRDVLVGHTLDGLPDRARIGTGSPRRALQLHDWAARHDRRIEVVPIRGNVDTRLDKIRRGEVDAVVLAAAGLRRLNRLRLWESDNSDEPVTEVAGLRAQLLSLEVMLPAPGQGALALEIHSSLSERCTAPLRSLDDRDARAGSLAERGFLAALEAGCTAPVGAHAVVKSVRGTSFDLTMDAVIGRTVLSSLSEPTRNSVPLRRTLTGTAHEPGQFGVGLGRQVLGELLADPTRPE